ncbi:MAG: M1 family aminopeptidase, partial [Promethearchaeota archaeon]
GKGPIPLAYYTSSNFKIEDLARSFADTPKFLKWLVNKFKCPLEWDKYYQIATAMHGGAMENISLVTWGDFAILNEKEAPELQLIIDDVNVHEMSHSWFGDMIVCKEFAHAWLKESWATYVEVLYFEDNLGQDMMQYQLYRDAKSYMEESDSKYARPIVTNHYDSSWDMYDHHLYPGGAWRIHMLRAKLGDEMFFSAVTDYLNTFKGKVVETIDFQRKLEDHSGYNLQEFFDQWLYAPGYPKLKAEFSYDDKTKLSCVKIEQTQEEEKKHIGLFKFPLKIRWETEDEKFEEKIYEITQKDQTLYFRSENKPLQIQIDPDYHLLTSLKFNPGLDMLIHQLKTANTIGKIKSAYTLSEDGSRKALNGLKEAYLSKPFWGVRIEIAKAVAKANHSYAIEILIGFLYHEEDPLVLESLIKTMDSIRDPRIFAAMESYLGRETKFYWATAAALQVIGAQRSMNAFNFLKSYEILDDTKGVVESGRFRAIGKTRLPEAIDYLIEFLPYGKSSDYTRNAVFSALVDSIHWADKSTKDRVLEKLADSIRSEPKESIFYRNLRTLSGLKDPQVISILENCRNRMALQGRPALDRMINAIQKATTPEEATKKFEKNLDEMKSEMKKLHAKVESLEEKFKLSKN